MLIRTDVQLLPKTSRSLEKEYLQNDASTSWESLTISNMLTADVEISFALSCHPTDESNNRSGGLIGPEGLPRALGRNGKYSRSRESRLEDPFVKVCYGTYICW